MDFGMSNEAERLSSRVQNMNVDDGGDEDAAFFLRDPTDVRELRTADEVGKK